MLVLMLPKSAKTFAEVYQTSKICLELFRNIQQLIRSSLRKPTSSFYITEILETSQKDLELFRDFVNLPIVLGSCGKVSKFSSCSRHFLEVLGNSSSQKFSEASKGSPNFQQFSEICWSSWKCWSLKQVLDPNQHFSIFPVL